MVPSGHRSQRLLVRSPNYSLPDWMKAGWKTFKGSLGSEEHTFTYTSYLKWVFSLLVLLKHFCIARNFWMLGSGWRLLWKRLIHTENAVWNRRDSDVFVQKRHILDKISDSILGCWGLVCVCVCFPRVWSEALGKGGLLGLTEIRYVFSFFFPQHRWLWSYDPERPIRVHLSNSAGFCLTSLPFFHRDPLEELELLVSQASEWVSSAYTCLSEAFVIIQSSCRRYSL